MNKEIFDKIKKELSYLGAVLVILFLILKIVFYNDLFLVILRLSLSLFFIFAVPGYFATLYWHDKINFVERLAAGALVSAGIIGIFSYYLGILGLNIKYHMYVLPTLIVVCGICAVWWKEKGNSKTA